MKKYQWLGVMCGSFFAAAASAQPVMVEAFEYGSDEELLAAWIPSANTVLTLSDSISPRSTGQKSMKLEFSFPSSAWATETIRGPSIETMLSMASTQYLTFRLRGDPAFAAADFRNLYLYAYDADGNFGRWGTAVPITDEWQILNFAANTIGAPWDSPGLPDFSRISRFAFFQYGSEAAIAPYTATIYIDELMVRDTPLTEFPMPSAPRVLIDDFENYADDAALRGTYTYQNSPATTVSTVSLQTPAAQGSKALKLAIDFAGGQWPWGSVRSPIVAPFSLPTNAVVSFQFKGDPGMTNVADGGTVVRFSFYDKAGSPVHIWTDSAPVISADWTTIQVPVQDLGNLSTVDIGNLVQWQILVEGWQGTADNTPLSGAFYIDDIRITVPQAERPMLSLVKASGLTLTLSMNGLTPGKDYDLRTSPNLTDWSVATMISATSTNATLTVTNDQQKAYFQLQQKP